MSASSGSPLRYDLGAAALLLALLLTQPGAAATQPAGVAGARTTAVRVDVDRLDALTIDSAGALTAMEGGLGSDMWRDTPRSLVQALLPRLPVSTPSPAMRQLMRRLLLTAAAAPAGDGAAGALLGERAWLLWRMGDLDGLRRLVGAVPASGRSAALQRLEAEALLLTEPDAACTAAESRVGGDPEVFWQKLLGYCEAVRGNADAAALTVSLLAERGEDVRSYRTLIEAIDAGGGQAPKLPDPAPLDVAMLRAVPMSPSIDAAATENLPILRAIGESEGFDPPLRLLAAERAMMSGVFPAEALYDLYRRVPPAKPAGPFARGGKPDSPPGLPALTRAALAADTPQARGKALASALEAGRRDGRYLAGAQMLAPLLAAAEPESELASSSRTLVPAMLVQGLRERAASWLDWLQQNRAASPVAQSAVTSLQPIARLARLPQAAGWSEDDLFEWWEGERSRPGGRMRAARLAAMLSATGDPPPEGLTRALLDGPAQLTTPTLDPAYAAQLERASRAGRVGETVLLALVALGQDGPETIDASGLQTVVAGLRSVGLADEARALAVETIAAR